MAHLDELAQLRRDLARSEGRLAALELELERAHRLLDAWGLPREVPDGPEGRPLELSLAGRLELLEEDGEEDLDGP